MKLEDKPDGSFLVRDSSDERYILSLSFRSHGVTHHTRIEHYKGEFTASAALFPDVLHCFIVTTWCAETYHLLFFVCRSRCQRNPQTLATGI